MSSKIEKVVEVDNLTVLVKNDDPQGEEFKFKIEYGSFDVNTGDFLLVKGRNGTGKSTFLRLFKLQSVNYFKVGGGSIKFLDDCLPNESIHLYSSDNLTKLNCRISYIGQEESFLSSDSAYSYIYNSCKYALACDKSLSTKEKRDRLEAVDAAIAEYYEKYLAASFQCKNYKTFKNKNVRKWSGGQQKMINVLAGIIKAKLCSLKLVVMDEPLNNLDGRNKFILNKLIAELRSSDVAVIAITHCQIFDGINKVLTITECDDGLRRASFQEVSEPSHAECLENYD